MTKPKNNPFTNLVLDKYEQEIEDNLENLDFRSIKPSPKDLKIWQKAASNTLKLLKKDTNMNIRVSHATKSALQAKAAKLGLKYQTLAGSILHQYANN
ncbi:hypothetical protein KBD69_05500 [Candidatus Woesebacteria bacterium]|nr:hypothetical protein [Candidatus Woesebacteria bacterium]